MNLKNKALKRKKWPLYCFYAAVAMLLFALVLYFVHSNSLSNEFGDTERWFGEQLDEIYDLHDIDDDITEPLLKQGKEALSFIGTKEECDAFGLLSRWCISLDYYPDADSVKATLDCIAAKAEDDTGYMWVAYTQKALDKNGELVCSSGSKDERILARWSIEKIDGKWCITEIKEGP